MISREHLEKRLEELQQKHEQVVLIQQQYVGAIAEVSLLLKALGLEAQEEESQE